MHDCKDTRRELIDLAFGAQQPEREEHLFEAMRHCRACQEEYGAIRNVLRIADQGLRTAAPGEHFWPGYRARLRQRLDRAESSDFSAPQMNSLPRAGLLNKVKHFAASSIRVPVPIAAALLLLVGGLIVFARHSRPVASDTSATQPVTTVTKFVEVPTIQEKVVTRTVYVSRNAKRSRSLPEQIASTEAFRKAGISLSGFKPTNQTRLTVIKGSYQNEK